jgi:hypothetical protein
VACVIDIPCQFVATGRNLVHRFLSCPTWLTQVMQADDAWKRLQFA